MTSKALMVEIGPSIDRIEAMGDVETTKETDQTDRRGTLTETEPSVETVVEVVKERRTRTESGITEAGTTEEETEEEIEEETIGTKIGSTTVTEASTLR